MRIAFDLDGVLRDLNAYLNQRLDIPYQDDWFWRFKDKDIFDWIKDDHYLCLVYAPITEYFVTIAKRISHFEIWTCQPEPWRKYTKLWITANIGECTKYYLDTKQKRERLDKNPDIYLVEDSPNFSNYDRIILIDRLYNHHVDAAIRIKHPNELIPWLEKSREAKNANL